MEKYTIIFEESQRKKVIRTWKETIESSSPPKVGDGFNKLVSPPIEVRVVDVKKEK